MGNNQQRLLSRLGARRRDLGCLPELRALATAGPMAAILLSGCVPSFNQLNTKMLYIAGGSFDGHVLSPFYLDETEVTVADFREWKMAHFWTELNMNDESECVRCPQLVYYQSAKAYCEWRSARLPTEWEWEWAARGREQAREYPWGSDELSCVYAVTDDACDSLGVQPVGNRPAGNSRDGLSDMAGNAAEWTIGVTEEGDEIGVLRGGDHMASGELRYTTQTSARFPIQDGEAFGGIRCAKSAE